MSSVAKVESSRTSFTSKPQILENCPVLGSRTTLFFEPLKLCWKMLENLFFWRSPEKKFGRLFSEHLRLCPWFLASSRVSSTLPLLSSVAEERLQPPSLACRPKRRMRKTPTCLALLRLFFLHWNGLKSDLNLEHLLKHVFRRGTNLKQNSQISKNFEKWPKISNHI